MAKRKPTKKEDLVSILSSINDPRVDRTKAHNLCDILTMGLCGMLCGHSDFTVMAEFAKARKTWFESFLELPEGIPSHDTFGRVFAAIDPDEFLSAFVRWTRTVRHLCGSGVVAIDGKALRRAREAGDQAPVIVGAWGAKAGISLGQVNVDEKSNEITALPELLDTLAIKGCIVTIDAMGCQKKVAKKIRAKGADYILALKDNQGKLYDLAKHFLDGMIELGPEGNNYYESEVERGHGRVEVRRCWACDELGEWLPELLESYGEWDGLESIAVVECERTVGGETTIFRRYFITSLGPDAEVIATSVREHWGIENSLHWVLDMVWREDESRARAGNAAQNLSSMRRLAHNLIKTEDPDSKKSVRMRTKIANWDTDYLLKLIGVKLDA
jgi:predicted transposase YbfD/YdcC